MRNTTHSIRVEDSGWKTVMLSVIYIYISRCENWDLCQLACEERMGMAERLEVVF